MTADEKLELRVVFGVVDGFCEFGKGGFVDDGADEVGERFGGADFEGFGFGDELGFHGGPEGGWDVGARGGAAFLALIFKGAADGVDDGVVDVGAGVDEVVVFAACFADDARVASVFALCDACCDFAIEAAEDGGAAGVVERCELAVCEDGISDLDGVARDELDDIRGKAGFRKDLVDKIIGSDC